MASSQARLFGQVGAEVLFLTIDEAVASAWQDHVEIWRASFPGERRPPALPQALVLEIEEHTVHPPQHHLPRADQILDFIAEHASENGELDEYGAEDVDDACGGEAATAVAEALRAVIASNVRYRMADQVVAHHRVVRTPRWLDGLTGDLTWDDDVTPIGTHDRATAALAIAGAGTQAVKAALDFDETARHVEDLLAGGSAS